MGRELPNSFGDDATRVFLTESRNEIPWWDTCITSALIDLSRVPGFIDAFCGIARVLRHGEDPQWVVGGDSVRAAMDVSLEWLEAGIEPHDVGGWLQAGCWNPPVARRLADAGLRPQRLLNENGQPCHWVEAPDGHRVPLALACTEWEFPIAEALRIVTGARYEVNRSVPNQEGEHP